MTVNENGSHHLTQIPLPPPPEPGSLPSQPNSMSPQAMAVPQHLVPQAPFSPLQESGSPSLNACAIPPQMAMAPQYLTSSMPLEPHMMPPSGSPPIPVPMRPREYQEFYRTPQLRWWKPLVALLLAIACFVAISFILSIMGVLVDFRLGNADFYLLNRLESGDMTPILFLTNNLINASMVLIAMGVQWLIFRQRPGWLSSIIGRFRWRLLGRFLLLALPFEFLGLLLDISTGAFSDVSIQEHTWAMLAIVILTTPFQCAGEEYACRGIIFRSVAAWIPDRHIGFAISATVSALVFMSLHAANDLWLNLYYFVFGILACVMTWFTGGLEAAVALHIVHNMLALLFLPFSSLEGVFNRESGAGSSLVLVNVALTIAAASLILWQAKRMNLPNVCGLSAGWRSSGRQIWT